MWAFFRDKSDAEGRRLQWGEIGWRHRDVHLDLPVEPLYVTALEGEGFEIRTRSRWLNAVTVLTDPEGIQRLRDMPFVRELRTVEKRRRSHVPSAAERVMPVPKALAPQQDYGPSFDQMAITRVTALHNLGFWGAGVTIALLDAGFNHREHQAFAQMRVKAVRDFVNGDDNVSDETDQPVTGDELANGHNRHGSRVLSVVGGYDPGNFIGVAPEAEFLLAKTEDDTQERPIEEDLWVAGLEWADSLGAQVVNSSIGYNQWDDGSGYTVDDLDGQTALTTIAAQTAISRGITIVAAAGNEANTPWKYVTVPADGADVISVGAIDLARRNIAVFSSHGPTADGRIKPDVVAPGVAVVVASGRSAESERDTYALSDYIRISGTSFAAPFVAGISALLIEIHPTWGPREIADALRQSTTDLGDAGPDTLYGWGLVDAAAASGLPLETPGQTIATAPFPNPAVLGGSEGLNSVFFPLQLATREDVGVSIFDLSGTLIAQPVQQRLEAGDYSRDRALRWEVPDRIDSGIYLYRLESETLTRTGRIAIVRDGR